MEFIEMKLSGAWLIDVELMRDHRGFFVRTFCAREFAQCGLDRTSYSWTRMLSYDGGGFHNSPGANRSVIRFMLPPSQWKSGRTTSSG